jgi:hypothetical protein
MSYKKQRKADKRAKRQQQKEMRIKSKALEALYDVKYVDGKPVKVKIDPLAELRKELGEPEEPINPADDAKRALYADLPQAHAKRDRSITARDLNMTLESYTKHRNEAGYKEFTSKGHLTILDSKDLAVISDPTGEYKFVWDKKKGVVKSSTMPAGKLKMEYTNPQIKSDTVANRLLIHSLITDHLKRNNYQF